MVCDLTIAAENAIFGQTGPKVGSFDGGFGSSYLAESLGKKPVKSGIYVDSTMHRKHWIWAWSTSCSLEQLEQEGLQWASEVMEKARLLFVA